MDDQGSKCRRKIAQIYNRPSRPYERYRRQTDGRQQSERERSLKLIWFLLSKKKRADSRTFAKWFCQMPYAGKLATQEMSFVMNYCIMFVSDIPVFVLKRDVKLQLANCIMYSNLKTTVQLNSFLFCAISYLNCIFHYVKCPQCRKLYSLKVCVSQLLKLNLAYVDTWYIFTGAEQ